VVAEVTKDKTYRLWHPQTGHEWVINIDRIRAFDPWETYNKGKAQSDKAFWERWIKRAEPEEQEPNELDTIAPMSVDEYAETQRVWATADAIKERSQQEEEEMRRAVKEKFLSVTKNIRDTQKPKRVCGYDYARDWSGEWKLYNTNKPNFEVIRLIDRRMNPHKNEWQWLVQWKGDWLPTWEPLDSFKEGSSTGLGLIWREYERTHPYAATHRKAPSIKNVNRRRR
jgi:hypothetical protein